jgi:hypothetical protein
LSRLKTTKKRRNYWIKTKRIRSPRVHFICSHIRIRIQVDALTIAKVKVLSNTHPPTGPKYIHLLAEHIIVHEASVHTEQRHEHHNVPTAEEDLVDFVSLHPLLESVLVLDQPPGEEKGQQRMASVAKHDGKQKRKRNDGKGRRIDLLIARDSVGIHQRLKSGGDFVLFAEGGRLFPGGNDVQNRLKVGVDLLRLVVEDHFDAGAILQRDPALGDDTLLVELEHVHGVVDGLHFADLAEPGVDAGGCLLEERSAQVDRLVQDRVQIVQACVDSTQHVSAFGRGLWTRVNGCL